MVNCAVVCFLVPAKLVSVSNDQPVQEGTNVTLFCEASGNPTPNIIWTKVLKDDSDSKVQHQGPTWDLPNINRTASGTYRCTANNGIGNPVSHKLRVNVLCKYITALNYFVYVGNSTCL